MSHSAEALGRRAASPVTERLDDRHAQPVPASHVARKDRIPTHLVPPHRSSLPEPHALRDDHLHDLVAAGVDRLHGGVRVVA